MKDELFLKDEAFKAIKRAKEAFEAGELNELRIKQETVMDKTINTGLKSLMFVVHKEQLECKKLEIELQAKRLENNS